MDKQSSHNDSEACRGQEINQDHNPRYDGTLTLHHALDAGGCDDMMVEHEATNGRDNGRKTMDLGGSVAHEKHDSTAPQRRH